jgi:hypothetical protein
MKYKFKANTSINIYNAIAAPIPVPIAIET